MSLPRSEYDPRRVCRIPFPTAFVEKYKRTVGVYISGALFALGHWAFLDAAILSKHAQPPDPYDVVPVHITFVDWIPGICSTLGMLVVNLINRDQLLGEGFGGEGGIVWRARLFLFLGFALMAGGLAGSIAIHVLKYVVPAYNDYLYYGYAAIFQNVAIMLSAIALWLAQNTSNPYEYNLSI